MTNVTCVLQEGEGTTPPMQELSQSDLNSLPNVDADSTAFELDLLFSDFPTAEKVATYVKILCSL